ncbi:MAG: hypothetical protein A4E47_01772 [Methanosaeta sp. PtaU1.Bin028]|nr:MAG: hypothetical protein A4E47_01772 [Methanosaeta sp. PtaU1.Bin028]
MVLMAPIMVVVGGTVTTSGVATLSTSPTFLATRELNSRGPLSMPPGLTGIFVLFCSAPTFLISCLSKDRLDQIVSVHYPNKLLAFNHGYPPHVTPHHDLDRLFDGCIRAYAE